MHPQTQAEQYALTIAALEEKLLAFMERYQQLTDENEALKQSLQSIADAPVNGTENQGNYIWQAITIIIDDILPTTLPLQEE